jgi:hypothetical protein
MHSDHLLATREVKGSGESKSSSHQMFVRMPTTNHST